MRSARITSAARWTASRSGWRRRKHEHPDSRAVPGSVSGSVARPARAPARDAGHGGSGVTMHMALLGSGEFDPWSEPVERALLGAMEDGLPYAGCSAGVACLTEITFDSDSQDMETVWAPGLGYVRNALFGPHWDMLDTWIPGATQFIVGSVKPGQVFVALDE